MIVSHRGLRVPELGAVAFDHSVLHPSFRVALMERDGVMVDDALFARAFPVRLDPSRRDLIVALEGRVRVRWPGRDVELREGDFVVVGRDSGWTMRYEGRVRVLIVEWTAGALSDATSVAGDGRLGARAWSAARAAVDPLAMHGPEPEIAAGVVELAAVLRAAGIPFERLTPAELARPSPPGLREIVHAADAAICALSRAPASVDLERIVGWSARHVQRRLRSAHAQFGFNASGGVRDLLGRWRIYAAAMLASTPGATTERVAALTGYSGPAPLCRAFAQRGLPSPGAIRGAVAAMG
ncbi:MAG TPA: hypothetical protein VIL20_07835 [Sandaracinaceae bacterium]